MSPRGMESMSLQVALQKGAGVTQISQDLPQCKSGMLSMVAGG